MKKRVKRQHGTSLHASGEDYLEAVLVLQKEKGMVRSVDVARHMGVSKPSVCHAVATLKEGGFLTMDGDFFLRLTDVGLSLIHIWAKNYRKRMILGFVCSFFATWCTCLLYTSRCV